MLFRVFAISVLWLVHPVSNRFLNLSRIYRMYVKNIKMLNTVDTTMLGKSAFLPDIT